MEERCERYVGVICRSRTEINSHYSKAVLQRQLDCYIWFIESRAVDASETVWPDEPVSAGKTYPFGL